MLDCSVRLIFFPVLVVLLTACGSLQPGPIDSPDDFLIDETHVISPEQAMRIAAYHERLLQELDIHFKVVIPEESPPDIGQTAVQMFEDYALGSRTRGAKGLLLIVDPRGRQTRIETGYDLEPMFTDAFVGYIQREQMTPFYNSERIGEGIEATVELLVSRLSNAIDSNAYDPGFESPPAQNFSGGAGANARLGATGPQGGRVSASTVAAESMGPQSSVEAAFLVYVEILEQRVKDPHLGIYSPETQDFLEKQLLTDAQQRNELAEIRAVLDRRTVVEDGDLALLSFPGSRRVPPYFFRKRGAGWMIDLSAMQRVIGFDQVNQWYVRDPHSEFSFGL
jgi:uncharacterized protein